MKKHILIIIFLFSPFFAKAQTTVVTDPGAYAYLGGIDKKLLESLEFLQEIQNLETSIKNSLSGNKKIGSGVNSSLINYDEFFLFSNNLPTKKSLGSKDRAQLITRDLDVLFPAVKFQISEEKNKAQEIELRKKKWQMDNIKLSLIFSEMILNTSRNRISQITALGNDVDSTTSIKEAMDVNNRLILELLMETRNLNLLLAHQLRLQSGKDFQGDIVADYKPSLSQELRGSGSLGEVISKTTKSSKFTDLAR